MGEFRKVLIVREEGKTKIPYVIDVMAEEWRRRRLEVEFSSEIEQTVNDGVLVIPHLDVTRTLPEIATATPPPVE